MITNTTISTALFACSDSSFNTPSAFAWIVGQKGYVCMQTSNGPSVFLRVTSLRLLDSNQQLLFTAPSSELKADVQLYLPGRTCLAVSVWAVTEAKYLVLDALASAMAQSWGFNTQADGVETMAEATTTISITAEAPVLVISVASAHTSTWPGYLVPTLSAALAVCLLLLLVLVLVLCRRGSGKIAPATLIADSSSVNAVDIELAPVTA